MSSAHSPTFPSLHLRHNAFSNPSVALPTSQLILQLFRCFTYVTAHPSILPLLYLRHSSFSNPSFASSTSQALLLRYLANRPCIHPTLVTKFSQNIVADTDKNKALTDFHKCSSSFLSIVKSHPLKIPASVLEKVRSGSCLKLFLIDYSLPMQKFATISKWRLPLVTFKYQLKNRSSLNIADRYKPLQCTGGNWIFDMEYNVDVRHCEVWP